ncbi:MAG: prepilin-type N-terminal cleavage/methylation domain-containing protein [Endomicrobium sp.]|jgi:prepilin-type N-terminal cleavage/methylation domain-containing protein|nr:prepilin-type N-terminal cleavage/methylation domain-containing protein [Endomicrobium sp.]
MKSKGFTLIEFIIVVTIVSTLSIIAIPVYKKYIEKAKTSQKGVLIEKTLN